MVNKKKALYVEDFMTPVAVFMNKKTKSFINNSSGLERTIKEFAKYIMKKLNVKLKIKYDLSKPNGIQKRFIYLKNIAGKQTSE